MEDLKTYPQRLADAIRKGSRGYKKCKRVYWDSKTQVCAIGAAMKGLTGEHPCEVNMQETTVANVVAYRLGRRLTSVFLRSKDGIEGTAYTIVTDLNDNTDLTLPQIAKEVEQLEFVRTI